MTSAPRNADTKFSTLKANPKRVDIFEVKISKKALITKIKNPNVATIKQQDAKQMNGLIRVCIIAKIAVAAINEEKLPT